MNGGTTFFPFTLGSQIPFLPKLAVRYNTTPATYLPGYTAGSNVISVTTIVPDGTVGDPNANTGLSVDIPNGLLIVKELEGAWSIFFDRTLTEITRQRAGAFGYGTQGVAYNHNTLILIDYQNDAIQEYRKVDGVVTYTQAAIVPPPYTAGGVWYDFVNELLCFTEDNSNYVRVYKKIAGVWVFQFRTWFKSGEGVGFDFVTGKMLLNGASCQERDFPTGLNIRSFVKPTAGTKAVVEGIFGDPKDGTIWFNSDEFYHGNIVGGNRLWRTDQREWYRQYKRYPDMIGYDMWKVGAGGIVSGTYNGQVLQGSVWSLTDITDYIANTGQQSIANWIAWHGTERESVITALAEIEFRGSNTAPTTASTTPTDYLLLPYYNANNSNDGWGSTVPSAWQSTPGTWRYMQAQLKPKPTPIVTPPVTPISIIGASACKIWIEPKNALDMVIDPDNNQIRNMPNKARMTDVPFADLELGMFEQSISANQPLFSTDRAAYAVGDLNTMLHMDQISADQQGELIIVGRRQATGTFGIFFGASDAATNANQLRFLQLRSSDTTPHSYCVDLVDGAGVLTRITTPADNNTIFKMISYSCNGSALSIFINKVSQILAVTGGANDGRWFADFSFAEIVMGAIRRLSGAITGATDIRMVVYVNRVLTTQERSDLYDYCVNKGLI